jgi:hypothetical protein
MRRLHLFALLLFVTSSQFQNLSVEKGYRFQIAGASQLRAPLKKSIEQLPVCEFGDSGVQKGKGVMRDIVSA